MVSKIKVDARNLKWFQTYQPVQEKEALNLIKKIPFSLPESFLNLLKIYDGGDLDYDFQYYNESLGENIGGGISSIYGLSSGEYNLISEYNDPPEFFVKNLFAFAEVGNGDLICFDYRNNPKSEKPPVVYWNHESEEGKNVSLIANDFEEFLSILKEPEEE